MNGTAVFPPNHSSEPPSADKTWLNTGNTQSDFPFPEPTLWRSWDCLSMSECAASTVLSPADNATPSICGIHLHSPSISFSLYIG